MFKVITPVAVEPVTLDEAKLHCKIDTTADDDIIEALIVAAREFAEQYTNRAFAEQTLEMVLDAFPDYDTDLIYLDLAPVSSVESIKYTDAAGDEQTFDSALYSLSTYGESRKIGLDFSVATWPLTQDTHDAVRIRYVTGYAELPKAAKQALLLVIAHYYENRGPADNVPVGALALLDTVKSWGR